MPFHLTLKLCQSGSLYTGPHNGGVFRARLITSPKIYYNLHILNFYDHCVLFVGEDAYNQCTLQIGQSRVNLLCPPPNPGCSPSGLVIANCNTGTFHTYKSEGLLCGGIPIGDWKLFYEGTVEFTIPSLVELWEELTGHSADCRICFRCQDVGDCVGMETVKAVWWFAVVVDFAGVICSYDVASVEFSVPCQLSPQGGGPGFSATYDKFSWFVEGVGMVDDCRFTSIQCTYQETDWNKTAYIYSLEPIGTFYNCGQPVVGGKVRFSIGSSSPFHEETTDAEGRWDARGELFIPPCCLSCGEDFTISYFLPDSNSSCYSHSLLSCPDFYLPPGKLAIDPPSGCSHIVWGGLSAQCAVECNCCRERLAATVHPIDFRIRVWWVDNRLTVVERRYTDEGFDDYIVSPAETGVIKFLAGASVTRQGVHFVFYLKQSSSGETSLWSKRSLHEGTSWEMEVQVPLQHSYYSVKVCPTAELNKWLILGLERYGNSCQGTLYAQMVVWDTETNTFQTGSRQQLGHLNEVHVQFDAVQLKDGSWRVFYVKAPLSVIGSTVYATANTHSDCSGSWTTPQSLTLGAAIHATHIAGSNLFVLTTIHPTEPSHGLCKAAGYSTLYRETQLGQFATPGVSRRLDNAGDVTTAVAIVQLKDGSWRGYYVNAAGSVAVRKNLSLTATEDWTS